MVNNIQFSQANAALIQQNQNSSVESLEAFLDIINKNESKKAEELFRTLWAKPENERPQFLNDPKALTKLFFAAIEKKQPVLAELLVDTQKMDLTEKRTYPGDIPLTIAAEEKLETLVFKLFQQGASIHCKLNSHKKTFMWIIKEHCSEKLIQQICTDYFSLENMRSKDAAIMLAELFDAGCGDLGIEYFNKAYSLEPKPKWLTEESDEISQLFCCCMSSHAGEETNIDGRDEIVGKIAPFVNPDYLDVFDEDDEKRPIEYAISANLEEITMQFCLRGAHIAKVFEGWDQSLFELIVSELGTSFAKDVLKRIDVEKNYSQLIQELAYDDDKLALLFCKRLEKTKPDWWQQEGMKEYIFSKALEHGRVALSLYLVERIDLKHAPKSATIEHLTLDDGIELENTTTEPLLFCAIDAYEKNKVFKRIINRMVELGVDLVQTKGDPSVSAFEELEGLFADDPFFMQRLYAAHPEMKKYQEVLSLMQSHKDGEAYTLIQEELAQKKENGWYTKENRCRLLFDLAIQNNAKEIAQILLDKINVFKAPYVGIATNGWTDILQPLLDRCSIERALLKELCANRHFVNFVIKKLPVANKHVRCLLAVFGEKKKKYPFITLAKRVISAPEVPSWIKTSSQLRDLYTYALEFNAPDLACSIVRLVPENETEIFIKKQAQTAVWDPRNPSAANQKEENVFDLAIQKKQISVVIALLSLPNVFGAIITKLHQALSKDELIQVYKTVALHSKKSCFLINSLLIQGHTEYADILIERILADFKELSSFLTTEESKGLFILMLSRRDKYKEWIKQLASAANLNMFTSNQKRIFQKIEETCGEAFVSTLLSNLSLEDGQYVGVLLLSLITTGKKKMADLLFKRITAADGPQWVKNPREYAQLFCVVVLGNETTMAEALFDNLDLKQRNLHGMTPLMLVAMQPKQVKFQALIEKMVIKGASFSDIDDKGRTAFSYVHENYPEITTHFVENCSLAEDQSSLLSIFVRENFSEFAITLFSRVQSLSTAPSWWTGKKKAELFFALIRYVNNNPHAKEIVDSLLADETLDVGALNNFQLNVLNVAINAKIEKSVINALATRGKKWAIVHHVNGQSLFHQFCNYFTIDLCTNEEIKQFCKNIGIGILPKTTYGAIISSMRCAMRQSNTPRLHRVIFGALLGETKWLKQYLAPCSFAEKSEYISFIGKKLSQSYADFVTDCAFEINERHYSDSVMPKIMPQPSSPIALGALKELFIRYGEKEHSIKKIEAFIERIAQKMKDVATPSSTGALEAFYKVIEDQVLLVLDYFKQEIEKVEKICGHPLLEAAQTNTQAMDILRAFRAYCSDCITVTDYCGTRLQDHARSYYVQYILKQKADFLSRMRSDLAEYRSTLSEAFLTSDPQSVHAYNAFLLKYGKKLSIPAGEGEIKDKFINGHEAQVERALAAFEATYKPSNIIHFIQFVLKGENNRDRFLNFLQELDSTARKSFESYFIDRLIQRDIDTKNFDDAGNSKDAKAREKIRERFSRAPHYIDLSDEDVTSTETIRTALHKKENKDRLLWGVCMDKEYAWVTILLLLLELKVLKS